MQLNESPFALLFDMDGVLVDSNPYHKIALVQFCKERGIVLTEEELKSKIYGRTNRDWITNVFGNVGEEMLAEYTEGKESLFREIYKEYIKPVEGLRAFLNVLDAAKVPRALATSAPTANVEFTLGRLGLETYFPVRLDDRHVSIGKPHPDIYLKAAAALGYEPARCVVFEDSLAGIEAGLKAGAKVVGITTTHKKEELSMCHRVISDFSALTPSDFLPLFEEEK
jgi:beta-phosphoglucomutase